MYGASFGVDQLGGSLAGIVPVRPTLVMWCECYRRVPYKPEFEELSRDRLRSRQNRDRIGTTPGDLSAAHLLLLGLAHGDSSTAAGPDAVEFGLCLGGVRTWPLDQVERGRASPEAGFGRLRI